MFLPKKKFSVTVVLFAYFPKNNTIVYNIQYTIHYQLNKCVT